MSNDPVSEPPYTCTVVYYVASATTRWADTRFAQNQQRQSNVNKFLLAVQYLGLGLFSNPNPNPSGTVPSSELGSFRPKRIHAADMCVYQVFYEGMETV